MRCSAGSRPTHPNELWTGDALHGRRVGGRKTYLFAFVDDHSRLVVGHRWGFAEDTVRLAAALRPALASRGVPRTVYVDNGSAFVDAWLLRACAKLGIRLTHSTPGRPAGPGKNRAILSAPSTSSSWSRSRHHRRRPGRDRPVPGGALLELNRLFTGWVETVYHHRVHSETGQHPAAPLAGPGGTAPGAARSMPAPATWPRRSAGPSTAP